MTGLAELKKSIPEAESLIRDDPEISEAERQALLAHLAAWTAASDIGSYVDAYCDTKLLVGGLVTLGVGEHLGTAKSSKRLALSLSYQGLPLRDVTTAFERAEVVPDIGIEQLRRDYGTLRMFAREGGTPCVMWSFRDDTTPANPLACVTSDATARLLLCRLGAGLIYGPTGLVYWLVRHRPDADTPITKPTLFDAGRRNWSKFLFGGRSKPDEECKDDQGVIEVVHAPVPWSQAASLIVWRTP